MCPGKLRGLHLLCSSKQSGPMWLWTPSPPTGDAESGWWHLHRAGLQMAHEAHGGARPQDVRNRDSSPTSQPTTTAPWDRSFRSSNMHLFWTTSCTLVCVPAPPLVLPLSPHAAFVSLHQSSLGPAPWVTPEWDGFSCWPIPDTKFSLKQKPCKLCVVQVLFLNF